MASNEHFVNFSLAGISPLLEGKVVLHQVIQHVFRVSDSMIGKLVSSWLTEKDSTQWKFIRRLLGSSQWQSYRSDKLWTSISNSNIPHVLMSLSSFLPLRVPFVRILTRVNVSYGNKTERSPTRSVVVGVITKSDDRAAGVRFVYPIYDYRPNWTTRGLITN